MIARRSEFCSRIETSLDSVISASGLELPSVRLRYRPSPALPRSGWQTVLEELDRLAPREIAEGRVLAGPHRDALEITWDGIEISKIASAGEKKIFGLLLCAARGRLLAELGRQSIVLLDDIDAELDHERLETAWGLFEFSPQVVASSCHRAVLETLGEVSFWHLESGSIASS